MCYHVSTDKLSEATLDDILNSNYTDKLKEKLIHKYHINGFKFPDVSIFSSEEPQSLQEYKWGLIPAWSKGLPESKMRVGTLNARSESIYEKVSYKSSAENGKRILIPVTGIFEWHQFHNGKKLEKYPFYIRMKEQNIFFLGGIWEKWLDKEKNELVKSFSLVTTEANDLMAKIHNDGQRMPVIIPYDRAKDWLDPKLPKEEVLALCVPYPSELMVAHTISKLLTSRDQDTDVPDVQKEKIYPELEYDKSLK